MRLEHHLVGGYVCYISPYIIIVIGAMALRFDKGKMRQNINIHSIHERKSEQKLVKCEMNTKEKRYKKHSQVHRFWIIYLRYFIKSFYWI